MEIRNPIVIFRGDDTDAIGYQTIAATIKTSLDISSCKAKFKYIDFVQTFDSIPADHKLIITIPANETRKFTAGWGYASITITDATGKVRTFNNRIPVFVCVNTPSECGGDVEIEFNAVPQLLCADNFDMLSSDWEFRQLVVKLAKYFGLKVINEELPEA